MAALDRLRSLCPTISVGVLSADLMNLSGEIAKLERAGVGMVHVDVMDGCFCPMLTVGPGYVRGLRTLLLKDVHLMVREPLAVLGDYVAAGADIITVHVESSVHIHGVLQHLGSMRSARDSDSGIIRGLALGPATPLDRLTAPLLAEVDMITLLGVDPGRSGRTMALGTLSRLGRVKQIIAESGWDILTCVDGGVTMGNVAAAAGAGADVIVTGSAVFHGNDPEVNAAQMLAAVRAASPARRRVTPPAVTSPGAG